MASCSAQIHVRPKARSSQTRTAKRCVTPLIIHPSQHPKHVAPDTLHLRVHSLLRCRDRSRHRIRHRDDLVQYRAPRALDGEKAARGHCDDAAQTTSLSVRLVFLLLAAGDAEYIYQRYQGHIGAALVLGGVDITGPQLFTIHPHGSTDKLPYVTMGSGSLAAMAVFESSWKPDLTVL